MEEIVKCLDEMPYFIKIILALPLIDGICWGVYRICKGKLLYGLLWIFFDFLIIGSIIDLYSLIKDKKINILA
jgi:hypothetical protein